MSFVPICFFYRICGFLFTLFAIWLHWLFLILLQTFKRYSFHILMYNLFIRSSLMLLNILTRPLPISLRVFEILLEMTDPSFLGVYECFTSDEPILTNTIHFIKLLFIIFPRTWLISIWVIIVAFWLKIFIFCWVILTLKFNSIRLVLTIRKRIIL